MKSALLKLKDEALSKFYEAQSKEQLNVLKAFYLGKKGELKKVLSSLGKIPAQARADLGKVANEVRDSLLSELDIKERALNDAAKSAQLKKAIDTTLPGRSHDFGALHPLTETAETIFAVLEKLGFVKASGPEIEHDFYNFEALNIPKSHPARDMQDTFYVSDDVVLRTHTSPVQIRAMFAKKDPPLRIMSFGRVFRRDDDITHSPMFTQIEGLYVDEHVSLADLKGTLSAFAAGVFSKSAHIRMRPSYFPFTEPSMEVDVSCFACDKDPACRLCKGTGWIEILGAGMVDPAVFTACGYDSEKYRGFAFGLGVERIAMLRHGIPDIRLFYENDVRFLRQF
ncbi:MAG: phenylalanine--tRNA ligase subunit alpha [Myxococcales bacterium]|nr:phenylalanine--tRNA ligase subunit alpha [Myxococcales bacterium]USN51918.1 MAG: phenylalanine--tRNA ligase subunit alpha [Myxococcales bacterium]